MLIGGTPLTFLATMPMLLMFLAWLVFGANLDALFPDKLLYVGMINLFLGNSIMVVVNMFGVVRRRNYGLTLFALANPLYWMLHSLASYKALWQLLTKPFYWEKTNHGLTKHSEEKPVTEPTAIPMKRETGEEDIEDRPAAA
jgi:hypothetical protein